MPMESTFTSMQRVFLGWDTPILHSAAEYLQSRYLRNGEWDMDQVLVVLPSSLAGRRLGELLAESAERNGFLLRPPEIVTVGTLPEKLYQAQHPFAGDSVQVLCWAKVLRESAPEDLQPLLVDVPSAEQVKPWVDLGSMLAGLHRELATDLMLFADVADRLKGTPEESRWRVLARLQRRYLDELHRHNLWDIQTARRVAIDHREPHTEQEIIVLSAVDLNRAQRRFLDAVKEKVTILIGSPESWSQGFDPYGALNQDYWQDIQVTVDPSVLLVRSTVIDAATEAVRQLAYLPQGTPTQEITIGVPDDELIPIVSEQMQRANVVARYGPGIPVNQTPPVQLLRALCDYLEDASFSSFATLIRLPAVSAMLRRKKSLLIDYLQHVDRYYEATLLRSVSVVKWPEHPERESVEAIVHAIDDWLRPLRNLAQPLSAWSKPLLEVMQACYSETTLNLDKSVDASLWDACAQVTDGIARLADIPEAMQIEVTVTEAIAWVQRFLEKARVPPPQDSGAIEMLGWLELALDDAQVLILTGMHDGTVPESVNADAFLPNELRRELGLMDNSRRYARDCYSLQTILHARAHVSIVINQMSAKGDPLTPSRLLLAIPANRLGDRVRFLLEPPAMESLPKIEKKWKPLLGQTNIPIPMPTKLDPPIALAVTDFRYYLECPYRYYLRRVEKLRAVDDASNELPANSFGTLVHDCLAFLYGSPVESSTDPVAIADWLVARLDSLVEERLGTNLRAAVMLQIEQAKQRLKAFSIVQAEQVKLGWKIYKTEFAFAKEEPVEIRLGGRSMLVYGRLDRIDFNESTRTWAVWDYKTSDTAKNPDRVHYSKSNGWTDFQLPLYRQMIRSLKEVRELDHVEVGYIQLPKSSGQTRFEKASFEDPLWDQAISNAIDVFEMIKKGVFWEPDQDAATAWDDFAAICQNDVARPWTASTEARHNDARPTVDHIEKDLIPSAASNGNGVSAESQGASSTSNSLAARLQIKQPRIVDIDPVWLRLKSIKADGEVPPLWFDTELIRASAGTGKTYNLAVRMIRLLFADQPLDHVLATTFTRKAAGEILHRVLSKLAKSICEEKDLIELQRDLQPLTIDQRHCEYQLARLCSELHRFRVSTLDAFYSQLAKSFSLELQLPPGWHLASEFEETQLRDLAITRLFEVHDRVALRTLLGMLFKGESGQSIQSQIRDVVNNGYKLFRVTEKDAWLSFPIPPAPSDQEVKRALVQIETCKMPQQGLATARQKVLAQYLEADWSGIVGSTIIANCFNETPTYSRTVLEPDLVDALQMIGKFSASQELALRHAQTKASYDLLQSYHEQLEFVKHQSRMVSFDDISFKLAKWIRSQLSSSKSPTESLAEKEAEEFRIAKNQHAIDFRMDSRIDHLLLDEFQDTSPAQWDIIRPFAESIAREGIRRDRSFFCVGDTKQAIYGWRGGVAEIFDSVQGNLPGVSERQLNLSYRSSPEVVEFVNFVFENLDRHPNFGEGESATRKWQIVFPKHETAKKGLPGYVQLVNGPPKRDAKSEEYCDDEETEVSLMHKAVDDLAALAQSAPNISIGVLVRRNRDVAKMIHLLRMKGVDASQEGGNPLTDAASVELMLSLLQLADHPADRIVAFHVANSPLAGKIDFKPMIETDRLAESIRKRIGDIGYGAAVAYYADKLAPECNERDQQRLEQLIQLAYQYDVKATDRIRDFVSFIRAERVALPTPSQVRVMTIHQSKGLEFDAVFLPDLDQQIKGRSPSYVARSLDRTANPTGIIKYFNKELRDYIHDSWKGVFEEVAKQQLTEALCVFYVALTRARQALYLYTTAHSKPANRWGSALHSILVPNEKERNESDRLLYTKGDAEWYKSATSPPEANAAEPIEIPTISVSLHAVHSSEAFRHRPSRKPSEAGQPRLVSLKQALEPSGSVGAIVGTLIHRWFEEIRWIEDFQWDTEKMRELGLATLSPEEMTQLHLDVQLVDMQRMLKMKSVRQGLSRQRYNHWLKQGVTEIEVSNERRLLEIFDGCLLRGTIDRLVLGKRKGVVIRAEILDYKTDSIDQGSSIEAWQRERVAHHLPQLEQYRNVLCKQFQIQQPHIELGLLLLSADSLISVGEDHQAKVHAKHDRVPPKNGDSDKPIVKQMTLDF